MKENDNGMKILMKRNDNGNNNDNDENSNEVMY